MGPGTLGASAISIGVLDAPALYDHYREVGNFTKDIGTTRITTAAIGETVSMVGGHSKHDEHERDHENEHHD